MLTKFQKHPAIDKLIEKSSRLTKQKNRPQMTQMRRISTDQLRENLSHLCHLWSISIKFTQPSGFAKQLLAVCLAIGLSLPVGALAQDAGKASQTAQDAKPVTLAAGALPGVVRVGIQGAPPQTASQPTSQETSQTQARPLPPIERVGVNVAEQTPLTLQEAIALALANNKDINASRIDVEMARFDLNSAKGIFDPRLTVEPYAQRQELPIASLIGGSASGTLTNTDVGARASVSGNTPLAGGSYQIDFNSARQTTDNQFISINPQFPSGLTLSYTQPLLRGLKTDDNRRRIEIARRNLSLTDSQFRQRAIETITRVQQAYWDLVFALRNLQVQSDAVQQARTQLESNRRQVEEGTLAPIDIVSAEVQVSNFEQNVYQAQEAVTRAENNLKQLMLPNRSDALWKRALSPTTAVDLAAPRVELNDAVQLALANRPEIEQVEQTNEINKINQKFFSDQLKPQVDLFGAYTATGLAGSLVNQGPNPFTAGTIALTERVNQLSERFGLEPLPPTPSLGGVPDLLLGGAGRSFSNLFGFNFPTARVGIRFTFPIGNRTAEANYGRSLAEGRKIQNQREQLEQNIEADVRNSLQALRSAEGRLGAAISTRLAAEQQSQSERRKFQAGLSTVFLVLERQQELITARGREVQAQTDLNKAIADFQRATGSTFKAHNIIVKSDETAPQVEQIKNR